MTRYHVTATQTFTDQGRIGVWLFLGSPVLQGIGLAWYISEFGDRYGQNLAPPALLMFLAGMGFLVGCLLLLIGREQSATVTVSESVKAAPNPVGDDLGRGNSDDEDDSARERYIRALDRRVATGPDLDKLIGALGRR